MKTEPELNYRLRIMSVCVFRLKILIIPDYFPPNKIFAWVLDSIQANLLNLCWKSEFYWEICNYSPFFETAKAINHSSCHENGE
jgi:hypothetical protein